MASGYVDLPHASYNEWKAATIGNEYDLDGYYGCQCWDYASLFWRNVGFGKGYPLTGNGYAYGCWTLERNNNTGDQFDLIYNLNEVKVGDIVVLDQGRFQGDDTGHIAFADENYNGTNNMYLLGQNQENASPVTGYKVTLTIMNVSKFLGAFRYKGWHTPPTPTGLTKKHFPWQIYARKLNQKRNGM